MMAQPARDSRLNLQSQLAAPAQIGQSQPGVAGLQVAGRLTETLARVQVYGQLEEPDGLSGLVQLRQGGLTRSDQVRVCRSRISVDLLWVGVELGAMQRVCARACAAEAGQHTGRFCVLFY
jgi:hypothetical protein